MLEGNQSSVSLILSYLAEILEKNGEDRKNKKKKRGDAKETKKKEEETKIEQKTKQRNKTKTKTNRKLLKFTAFGLKGAGIDP